MITRCLPADLLQDSDNPSESCERHPLEVQGRAPVCLGLQWAVSMELCPKAFTDGCPWRTCLISLLSSVRCATGGALLGSRSLRHGASVPAWGLMPKDTSSKPAFLCLCVLLMHLRLRCRFFAGTRRRAKALEHLPGPTPKYWLPGFMGLIVSRQPHRYATKLAEKFGPIFKFRVLWYHVSLCPLSLQRRTSTVCKLQGMMHTCMLMMQQHDPGGLWTPA